MRRSTLASAPLVAEIAALFLIREKLVLPLLQFHGPFEPAHVEGGFVKIQESLDEERVVAGEAIHIARTLAIATLQRVCVCPVEFLFQKLRGIVCRV